MYYKLSVEKHISHYIRLNRDHCLPAVRCEKGDLQWFTVFDHDLVGRDIRFNEEALSQGETFSEFLDLLAFSFPGERMRTVPGAYYANPTILECTPSHLVGMDWIGPIAAWYKGYSGRFVDTVLSNRLTGFEFVKIESGATIDSQVKLDLHAGSITHKVYSTKNPFALTCSCDTCLKMSQIEELGLTDLAGPEDLKLDFFKHSDVGGVIASCAAVDMIRDLNITNVEIEELSAEDWDNLNASKTAFSLQSMLKNYKMLNDAQSAN